MGHDSRFSPRAIAKTLSAPARVAVLGIALAAAGFVALQASPALAWKAPVVSALCATDANTFRFQVTLSNEPNGKMEWSWNQNFNPNTNVDLAEPGTSTVTVPREGHVTGDTWRIRFRDDFNAKASVGANGNLCTTPTPPPTPSPTPPPTPSPTPPPTPSPTPKPPTPTPNPPTPTPNPPTPTPNPPTPTPQLPTPTPPTQTPPTVVQPTPQPTQPTAVLPLAFPATGGVSETSGSDSSIALMGTAVVFLFGLGILWLGLQRHLRRAQIRVRVEDDQRD